MFEIHVTVRSNDVNQFRLHCAEFGCKPLLIELQNGADTYQQLMTTQKFSHSDWVGEIDRVKTYMSDKYHIERIKVEINPYAHQGIPIKYFETHYRIKANPSNIDILTRIISDAGFHKSKNIFKRINDVDFYQMATYRTYDIDITKFEMVILDFRDTLTTNGFEHDKVEVEACIIDTNDSLDYKWLNKN